MSCEVLGTRTPIEPYADWVSPEQSKQRGPVPPQQYGFPICLAANATICRPCSVGGGSPPAHALAMSACRSIRPFDGEQAADAVSAKHKKEILATSMLALLPRPRQKEKFLTFVPSRNDSRPIDSRTGRGDLAEGAKRACLAASVRRSRPRP